MIFNDPVNYLLLQVSSAVWNQHEAVLCQQLLWAQSGGCLSLRWSEVVCMLRSLEDFISESANETSYEASTLTVL